MLCTPRTWALSALALTLLLSACNGTTSTPDGSSNTAPTVTLTASPMTGTAPYSSVLTATATDPEGDALTYMWTTPDGTVPGSSSFSYTMSAAGSYPVAVTVSDGNLSASQSTTLSATAAPNVPGNRAPAVSLAVTPKSGNAPLEVSFTAQGQDPDGDALTYLWSFGDGESAGNVTKVSHTYQKAGSYKAKVTVSDGRGGTDSTTQTVTVKGDESKPDPVQDEGTVELELTPDNTRWQLGDQSGTGNKTLTLKPGSYNLTLTPGEGAPYLGETRQLSVVKGVAQTVTASLTPDTSITFHYSFYESRREDDEDDNSPGYIDLTQGGTLSVNVYDPQSHDIGTLTGFDLDFAGEQPGDLTLTYKEDYWVAGGRTFVYRVHFSEQLLNTLADSWTSRETTPWEIVNGSSAEGYSLVFNP